MVRKLAILLVLFVYHPPVQAETPYEWTKPFSVRVRKDWEGVFLPGQPCGGAGSGTVIYRDKNGYDVITCDHVVEAEKKGKVYVQVEGEKWQRGYPTVYWKERDLALIHITQKDSPVEAAVVAEKVDYTKGSYSKCGYPTVKELPPDDPFQNARHVASGKIASGIQFTHGSAFAHTGDSVIMGFLSRSGDSGGGLFRNSDHAFVGVVWGSGAPNQTLYATQLSDIKVFLDYADKKRKEAKSK